MSPVSVSAPVKTFVPERFRSAPVEDAPAPSTLTGSGTTILLVNSRDAPFATMVDPAALPKPAELDTDKTPVLTVVVPVYVFAAARVRVPAPLLMTL